MKIILFNLPHQLQDLTGHIFQAVDFVDSLILFLNYVLVLLGKIISLSSFCNKMTKPLYTIKFNSTYPIINLIFSGNKYLFIS